MVEETEKIGRATLVDEVADRLRLLLLSGEIEAGERLRMRELQDRFGVSHIPIREALRTLESEGLVETQPQRGAVATEVSLDVLGQVYDARRLLEPPIAERAVTRFSTDDLAELTAAFERLRELEKAGTVSGSFFAEHQEFHWLTLRPGASEVLERTLRHLWGIAERFVRLSVHTYHTALKEAPQHHQAIYQACLKADPAIRGLIEEHLHVTENYVRSWFDEHEA